MKTVRSRLNQLMKLVEEKRTARRPHILVSPPPSPPLAFLVGNSKKETIPTLNIKTLHKSKSFATFDKSSIMSSVSSKPIDIRKSVGYDRPAPSRRRSFFASLTRPSSSRNVFKGQYEDSLDSIPVPVTVYETIPIVPAVVVPDQVRILFRYIRELRYEDFVWNLLSLYPGVMYQDPVFQIQLFGKEGDPEDISDQTVARALDGLALKSVLEKYIVSNLNECRRAVVSRGGNGTFPLISSLKSNWFDIAQVLVSNNWISEFDDQVRFFFFYPRAELHYTMQLQMAQQGSALSCSPSALIYPLEHPRGNSTARRRIAQQCPGTPISSRCFTRGIRSVYGSVITTETLVCI
jgi:hypothetical protein